MINTPAITENQPVTDRIQDLQVLQHQLEELTREMNQFTYIVSHDLQAPLRMVTGFLELLLKRYSHQLDEEARQFIGYAIKGSGQMKRLIADLLDFSRVSNSEEPVEPTDLGELLAEARQLLITETGDSEPVSFEFTATPMPVIRGRKKLLLRLFTELLRNALKFRFAGRRPEIAVRATRGNQEWTIRVKDNGIGIEPAFFDKIFLVFRRLHSGEELYPGTGMGLALCRKIVALHGGQTGVESVPGTGSEFWITLPDL